MTIPRPEYPRPQFVRDEWLNLNGQWHFDYDDRNEGLQQKGYNSHNYSKNITVPFCYQSELSGIGETEFHDVVWYKKNDDDS